MRHLRHRLTLVSWILFSIPTAAALESNGIRSARRLVRHYNYPRRLQLNVIQNEGQTTAVWSTPSNAKVLSEDPLVYVIEDLLSDDECQAYISRVNNLQETRPMKRSNPPEVSLDVSKLWPLPFLSLLSALPPMIRLFDQQQQQNLNQPTTSEILTTILTPVALTLVGMIFVANGIVLPLIKSRSADSSRTSEAMAFNLEEDIDFVSNFVNRVQASTTHPWHAWEAPVVTRYDPGAIFSLHGDASPTLGSEWFDTGGQRVITCICYLNDVSVGGETSFDKLNIAVRPHKGSALVFFPADPVSLRADDRTTHESLPPEEDKWIVQMFGRVGPRVPPPLGLPDSYQKLESKDG